MRSFKEQILGLQLACGLFFQCSFFGEIGQKRLIFRPHVQGVKHHRGSKSKYPQGFIHKTTPKNAW